MAKGFIIEEVHVISGTVRLRDSRTGRVVDVPLTAGGTLTLPGAEEADSADTEEGAPDEPKIVGGIQVLIVAFEECVGRARSIGEHAMRRDRQRQLGS